MRILLPSELKNTPVTSNTLNELYIASPGLVGREDDLDLISGRLRRPDQRLVTITGPGGIGKSRLALEAALKLREQFTDGVYFVSLVAVTSPELILSAIADEFRFSPQSRIDLKSRFLAYLNGKNVLIVLDNFEHLLASGVGPSGITDGAGMLKELLLSVPSAKFLITSRQRVGLQAEWVFELQGLPFPKTNTDRNPESYGAVLLFMKLADKLCPGRSFSVQEKQQVSRICHLAGGLPLGINLAASWVRTLSCKEIADEIEKNLDFLAASGDADIPLRHRSLRHVFEQSWRNLSENERQVLRRMSVFRAGCQKDAAQDVADASLSVLSSLIDKSLLCRKASGGDELQSRYDLHELLRQYAEEKLTLDPEDNYRARQAHCEYYVKFVRERASSLISGNQRQA
ncbi:MAG: AAA family ATPase, partial [Chlorobiales bacterium]|nr:AAA family ATPase [Chlorobiales bacterium]